MANITELIYRTSTEPPNTPLWIQAFNAVHPEMQSGRTREEFSVKCAVGAFLETALTLIPTDYTMMLRREAGNAWASTVAPAGKTPDPTRPKPEFDYSGQFFCRRADLASAVCALALQLVLEREGKPA